MWVSRLYHVRTWNADGWEPDGDVLEALLAPTRYPHGRQATSGAGLRGWLHARLYVRPSSQDRVLAERLPTVLESLPADVDSWYFLRDTGPDPHLRLSFGGSSDPLCTSILGDLRSWTMELAAARLATRFAIDVCPPVVGDPATIAEVEEVLRADSDAVLGQLRLGRARAFAIAPDVLAELGRDDIARAFRRDPRPAGTAPGRPAWLAYWWEVRAEAVRRYGDRVRRLAAEYDNPRLAASGLDALLRMHSNRVLGHHSRGLTG
jgi:hypothetical protein